MNVIDSYVPFKVFQLIALWADKKHKLAILDLLEQISTHANLINRSAYDALNETIALKEKRIEELFRVEDENKTISNELSSIKESLENEKLKTSQWKSNYIQLKRALKDLGDD